MPPSEPTRPLGGVIHTYLGYDPQNFPPPSSPPPDVVSTAFEHMLQFGSMRRLTDEELARAIKLDPSQIAGMGPSLDMLIAMLEERKRKILAKYETKTVEKAARKRFQDHAKNLRPPKELDKLFRQAVKEEQVQDLEHVWYQVDDEQSPFARDLIKLATDLSEQYQVQALDSKYAFTGREKLSISQALEVKEELEKIDRLLEQLKEAAKTAQIGVIDLDELSEFAEPGDVERLNELQQRVQEYLRELAEQQGLEKTKDGYRLTPKAHRVFQGKLLATIFSELQAARSGRHQGPISGEGAVEIPRTKQYEFGDSVTHMDMTTSLVNAMVRSGPGLPIRMKAEDIEIHRTRNSPKCATMVLLDMSGSMRYDGQYINVKRMGLALDGLIRTEYPGDFLRFVEIYSFAKLRHVSELASIMPKMPTIHSPVVRMKYDMSKAEISEAMVHPHFTNIQRALQIARQTLAAQDTPNRQVVLITDGLPTAHFEGEILYLLYPPDPRTESATLREAQLCAREGITLNIVLLSSWSQTHEDVQFAYKMAETTKGRVFFSAGHDLDRFVVHDYVNRRKQIIGG